MRALRRVPFGYAVALLFAALLIGLHLLDISVGQRLVHEFTAFSMKMVVLVPCIFILIGLLDAWVPQQWIQKHVGEHSGIRGIVYVIMLAMFQGGPLYGAFPTAHLLWKKGCSMRNVFMYLGAFSTLKIPMMLFEANFLGWRFTLVRGAVALPVFVLTAEIMAAYARGR
jgi:uncharacterized membrane protein YraQ (UPF0718 family)